MSVELQQQVDAWSQEVHTPPFAVIAKRAGRRRQRRLAAVSVSASASLLVVVGAGGLILTTHGADSTATVSAQTAGRSLEPLDVFEQRAVRTGDSPPLTPGQRLLKVGSMTYVVRSMPAVSLHVVSARVQPVSRRWLVELVTSDGDGFDLTHVPGRQYLVQVPGGVARLIFVEGSTRGERYAVLLGQDEQQAVDLAHRLTTSVVIDR